MTPRALGHRRTRPSVFTRAMFSSRFRATARALGVAGVLSAGFLAGFGCNGSTDSSEESNIAALKACHLLDGTVDPKDELRACDPGDKHKTTICHIPPGNPANAHTLCVGNPAVPAHLRNHGDYLGPCHQEQPCPPPNGGATGSGGGGASGAAGTTGTGGGAAGSPGTGGTPTIVGIG